VYYLGIDLLFYLLVLFKVLRDVERWSRSFKVVDDQKVCLLLVYGVMLPFEKKKKKGPSILFSA
jgi:hypothetical protein